MGEAVLSGFDMHISQLINQPMDHLHSCTVSQCLLFALIVLSLLKLGKNTKITAHFNYCRKDKSLLKGPNVLALDVGHY